jgi:hypothetical protein
MEAPRITERSSPSGFPDCRKAREFNAILVAMTDDDHSRFDEIDLAAMATAE